MIEIVTINEVNNEGKSIHLYLNGLVGLFASYGYSAFQSSKEVAANTAYSGSIYMPVAVINSAHLEKVIKKFHVSRH